MLDREAVNQPSQVQSQDGLGKNPTGLQVPAEREVKIEYGATQVLATATRIEVLRELYRIVGQYA